MDPNFGWTTRSEKLLVVEYWWKKQNALCCICGEEMEPYKRQRPSSSLAATIEHLVPKRDNGPNTVGNVRLAHAKCNHALGGLWSINQDRAKHGLPPLTEAWALNNLERKRKNAGKRRPAYKAAEPKPIKGTLAHAVMIGEVSEDLMYKRPKPMDIKLNMAARKMTAVETARWLAQKGIRTA